MFLMIINAFANVPLIRVYTSNGEYDIEGFICPNAEIDGEYKIYTYDGAVLNVNGWLATDFEVLNYEC